MANVGQKGRDKVIDRTRDLQKPSKLQKEPHFIPDSATRVLLPQAEGKYGTNLKGKEMAQNGDLQWQKPNKPTLPN